MFLGSEDTETEQDILEVAAQTVEEYLLEFTAGLLGDSGVTQIEGNPGVESLILYIIQNYLSN